MQKASVEMDLGEWELVDDRYFKFSRKPAFRPDGIVDVEHFSPGLKPTECVKGEKLLIPRPIRLDSLVKKDDGEEEVRDVPVVEKSVVEKLKPYLSGDQELVSQVFFNNTKMKKNEFADMMKIDSPPRTPTRELRPQFEVGLIQYDREGSYGDEKLDYKAPQLADDQEIGDDSKGAEKKQRGGCWEGGVLTIWKWKIKGIGGLCSVGMAGVATICILIIGSRQRHRREQNQRPQFQIYPEDKRIQQVVHQATRLNQALLTRATFKFGGHFDAI